MKEILVIGAGAAGIMAALAAAEAGARVHLFEKNDIVGKKLGITGKGRCNLTNSCTMADFIPIRRDTASSSTALINSSPTRTCSTS